MAMKLSFYCQTQLMFCKRCVMYLAAALIAAFFMADAHKGLAEDLNAKNSLQEYVNQRREEWSNSTWQGKLKDGKSINPLDLQAVIDSHEKWLATNKKEGNKADLTELRAVSPEEINDFFKGQSKIAAYFNTSALTGTNVENAFIGLVTQIVIENH